MCLLDGTQYAKLQEAGREKYAEDVEGCIVLLNKQVRGAEKLLSLRQPA